MANKLKLGKIHIIILIISSILIVFNLWEIFSAETYFAKPDFNNLVEFEATLVKTEIVGDGENSSTILHTEEFGNKIMIRNNKLVLDLNDIYNLKSGDKIQFTLEKALAEDLENSSFAYVITLQSGNKIIISPESVMSDINNSISIIRRDSVISLIICLIIFVISLILAIVKIHRNKKISNV